MQGLSPGQAKKKPLSIDPLKMSAPLGAALVFLGMDRAVPILHGSQGCAAFAKNVLTRHFREPIPLGTTALSQETVILGAQDAVFKALDNTIRKQNPSVIGMITTALTETSGDDVEGAVIEYGVSRPGGPPVVVVHAPDFRGGLSTGYRAAVEAVVKACVPPRGDGQPWIPGQVNLIFGPGYGPGDVEEVKNMVAAMGLSPLALPDLSTSMDGHLGDGELDGLDGGTSLSDLARMSWSAYTFSFGRTAQRAGEDVAARAKGRHVNIPHLNTLDAVDDFLELLLRIGGGKVPESMRIQRDRLMDRMLDVHALFSGIRVVLAGEPDWLCMTEAAFVGMGASVVAAVAADDPKAFGYSAWWPEGDYGDLEECVARWEGCSVDLWVSNSHGARVARRTGVPFLSGGLPVWDRLGVPNEASVGYRGLWEWLARVGSRLMQREEVHPSE
ncbi:nitrogenase iron-molybdenum cofactor biosynthesis protein NifN [Kyrpidia spormannii]|nr:nitrogenase iron-molybdenum cofactor biosynthesis protein NifN [Kyrpidia spormannii]